MIRRAFIAVAWFATSCLAACSDEPPEPPGICKIHCITEAPPYGAQVTCCDSITCYYEEETESWQVIACDMGPAPDAGADAPGD
jgi:hypothetical protein